MIEQINIDQPPLEITQFLDRLHLEGQHIVPNSLIWLPHPTRTGRMVAAVMVEQDKQDDERKRNNETKSETP